MSRRAGHRAQCGSSLQPSGASGLPAGCCGQASRTTPGWRWISVSSSLLEGYDEPEILRSSSHQFCLTSAEAGQPNPKNPRWVMSETLIEDAKSHGPRNKYITPEELAQFVKEMGCT